MSKQEVIIKKVKIDNIPGYADITLTGFLENLPDEVDVNHSEIISAEDEFDTKRINQTIAWLTKKGGSILIDSYSEIIRLELVDGKLKATIVEFIKE